MLSSSTHTLSAHRTQGMVYSIVNKLGVYDVAHTVTDTTTHIVCGANRRTFNILAGTAKGCWILSLEWVREREGREGREERMRGEGGKSLYKSL